MKTNILSMMLCIAPGVMCAQVKADTTAVDKFANLREVVIKGDLPNTRLKGNAMVTRIEGTPLGSSGMADEMLMKVPGMTGGDNGPEVIGKGTPLIYLNGRLIRNTDELKRVHSEDIRDVEVINNPGAQYDATVKAVVRIRTKKQQGDGVGVTVAAVDEQDLRYGFNNPNAKVDLNYRKNGLDLFGGVWYYKQDYRQYSSLEETTITPGLEFRQYGPYTMTWKHEDLEYTAGANWQINDNHSVGARVDLEHNLWGKDGVIYDENLYENGVQTDNLYSEQKSDVDRPLAWLTNAYYNGKVGKLGIDLNVDYKTTEKNTDRVNREVLRSATLTNPDAVDYVNSASNANSHLFATKLVLSYPLWRGTVEAGTEMTFLKRHNTYTIDKASIKNTDAEISENTIAGFAEYSCDFGKVGSANVGLRYEHAVLDYDDLKGTDDLHRPMDDFFPSASFATKIGKVQTSIAYSAKISRPNYFALNDAVTYISRYSLQSGNTKLKNEKLQELTLDASWKWLTLSASYERCSDCIVQWAYLHGDAVLIKHDNLNKPYNTLGAYLIATPRVGIYSLNATVGVEKQDLSLEVTDGALHYGEPRKYTVDYKDPIYIANLYNTFSFKHNWQVDLNIQFLSKGCGADLYNSYNKCRVGLVLQKSFLPNNALTVRAAVLDLLQRNRLNEYSDMGYYRIQQNNRYSTHKLYLSAVYRFNSARSKYKGTGAGKDAQARMKN